MKNLLKLALLASASGFICASCTTYVDPDLNDDTATSTTTTTRAVDTPIGTSQVTEETTTTTTY